MLTAIAIVLGVAMMSGAYVLTDTIDKAFDAIFVESYADTERSSPARRRGSARGEQSPPVPIPEDVLDRSAASTASRVATGSVNDSRPS